MMFYDNSILSGTKITEGTFYHMIKFYDNSILSGTKINGSDDMFLFGFTITQFFQVLK